MRYKQKCTHNSLYIFTWSTHSQHSQTRTMDAPNWLWSLAVCVVSLFSQNRLSLRALWPWVSHAFIYIYISIVCVCESRVVGKDMVN